MPLSNNQNSHAAGASVPLVPLSNTAVPKFRDQWTFLDLPSCPPELKILAADKIKTYRAYVAAHAALFDCTTLQEQANTVQQLIEAFIENRAIHKEFEYFQKHKAPLMLHPVFKEYQELRIMRKLSELDLYLEKKNLEHAIWRLKRQIKSKKQNHLNESRSAILQQKERKLQEVTRLLEK